MADPQIQVHRFFKSYRQNPKDAGQMEEIHWVEYGPLGNKARMTTIDKVRNILGRLQQLEGSSDPAVMMAHARAAYIEPRYEAWKRGEAAPVDGTPLAAWNGLSPEQAEALKMQGINTVEEIAGLTESTASRMPFSNKHELIKLAKNFVESKDQTRLAAALSQKDEEIAQLRLENEERDALAAKLMKKIDDMAAALAAKEEAGDEEPAVRRGPGRPPKPAQQAAA